MPYKEKDLTATERMRCYREKKKGVTQGVTNEGVTGQGVTSHNKDSAAIETVPASYVPGANGKSYQMLPERPRYLTLSDGQVLDRLNQPTARLIPAQSIDRMLRANDSAFAPFKKRKPVPEDLKTKLVKV